MNMSAGLNEKLRGLLDSVARLASLPGLEHLAGEVLEEYGRLTGARGGSFYSREGPTLVLRGCLDPGHAPQSLSFPAGGRQRPGESGKSTRAPPHQEL